jgi:hypothetical protein
MYSQFVGCLPASPIIFSHTPYSQLCAIVVPRRWLQETSSSMEKNHPGHEGSPFQLC